MAGRYAGDSEPGWGEGARHKSIEEAMEAADADGTASILDIESVSLEPDNDLEPSLCGVAYPLARERLIELFGTDKPTSTAVEDHEELYALINRGCCYYILVYDGGKTSEKPSGIFWAGYSYD
jgi:hypothetical protein